MDLADLKPYPRNPRDISEKAIIGLKASLARFGDISGIVWNSRSGFLISGHQRLRSLQEQFGESLEFDPASARIECPDGTAFAVRIVDWDEDMEKAANVAANSPLISGEFDAPLDELISELQVDAPQLLDDLRMDELLESLGLGPEIWPAPPEIPEGMEGEYRQISFTVHESQHEIIKEALKAAIADGSDDDPSNANKNGNALAHLARAFLQ